MAFIAGEHEIQESIEPKKEGVDVFLVELPKIIKGKEGKSDQVEFTFRSADNPKQTQAFRLFDFVNQGEAKDDKAKRLQNNVAQRGVSMFTALMTPEKKEAFNKIPHEDFEGFCNTAFKYIDPAAATAIKLKIMFGYSNRSNYKELQMFGPCISSQYDPKTLVWNATMNLTPSKRQSKGEGEEKPDEDLV